MPLLATSSTLSCGRPVSRPCPSVSACISRHPPACAASFRVPLCASLHLPDPPIFHFPSILGPVPPRPAPNRVLTNPVRSLLLITKNLKLVNFHIAGFLLSHRPFTVSATHSDTCLEMSFPCCFDQVEHVIRPRFRLERIVVTFFLPSSVPSSFRHSSLFSFQPPSHTPISRSTGPTSFRH